MSRFCKGSRETIDSSKSQAEARATVTKEMCSANYLKAHSEILKAYPRLTRRGLDGMLGASYTYFGEACYNLGVYNGNVDIWIDNKYNIKPKISLFYSVKETFYCFIARF